MLAGIGPVPAVLLVVAADEGWCRQTAEHLAALDALGVRHGVLAVTRSDLGDADLAIEEARDYLADSSLADIEAVAVSPVTGTGIDELRAALLRMTARARSARVTGDEAVGRSRLQHPGRRYGRDRHPRQRPNRGRRRVDGVVNRRHRSRPEPGESQDVDHVGIGGRAGRRQPTRRQALEDPSRRRIDHRRVCGPTSGQWTYDSSTCRPDCRPNRSSMSARPRYRRDFGRSDLTRLGSASTRRSPCISANARCLRDPGRQHVVAGIVVLDTDPPRLARRGAAARRAEEIAAVSGDPDPAGEVRRRRAVRFDQLVAAGVMRRGDPATRQRGDGRPLARRHRAMDPMAAGPPERRRRVGEGSPTNPGHAAHGRRPTPRPTRPGRVGVTCPAASGSRHRRRRGPSPRCRNGVPTGDRGGARLAHHDA